MILVLTKSFTNVWYNDVLIVLILYKVVRWAVVTKDAEILRRISWCECSWVRSDWVCWVWCSQWWDSEVVKSFRRRMPALRHVSRMVYWTSLRWCSSYVSYSPCILLFSNRLCVTWQLRPMWSKFSHGRDNFQKLIVTQTPSLSRWHGLDNGKQLAYKPSVKYIFRCSVSRTRQTKKTFQQSRQPDHSDQDSDTDGWTRLRRSWGLNE